MKLKKYDAEKNSNVHFVQQGTIKGTSLSESQWLVTVDVVTMPLLEWETADTLWFTQVFEGAVGG